MNLQKELLNLYDLKDLCGIDRDIVLMKEITKRYEQHFGFNIENVIKELEGKELKGEFTLIISGKKSEGNDKLKEQYLRDELSKLIQAGLSPSAAANYLSSKSKLSRNKINKIILKNDLRCNNKEI